MDKERAWRLIQQLGRAIVDGPAVNGHHWDSVVVIALMEDAVTLTGFRYVGKMAYDATPEHAQLHPLFGKLLEATTDSVSPRWKACLVTIRRGMRDFEIDIEFERDKPDKWRVTPKNFETFPERVRPKPAKPKAALRARSAERKGFSSSARGADGLWNSSEAGWQRFSPQARLKERPVNQPGPPPSDPVDAVREVAKTIDLANAKKLPKGGHLDRRLSAAWASAVTAGLGWVCVDLRDDAGRMEFGLLVDAERRWFVNPHALMRRLLLLDGSGWCGDNTAELLYNLIAAHKLPPSGPGQYVCIS